MQDFWSDFSFLSDIVWEDKKPYRFWRALLFYKQNKQKKATVLVQKQPLLFFRNLSGVTHMLENTFSIRGLWELLKVAIFS